MVKMSNDKPINPGETNLFRSEVVEGKRRRLDGAVRVTLPKAWRTGSWVVFLVTCLGVVFVSTLSYPEVATVQGVIQPSGGVAAVIAQKSGLITKIYVREDAAVRKGEPLALIDTAQIDADNNTLQFTEQKTVEIQSRGIERQKQELEHIRTADHDRLLQVLSATTNDIKRIGERLRIQNQSVIAQETSLSAIRAIAAKGFISKSEVQRREDDFRDRQQRSSELAQAFDAKVAEAREVKEQLRASSSEQNIRQLSLQSSLISLARDRSNSRASESYLIRAPITGHLSSFTLVPGAAVRSGESVMEIASPTHPEIRVIIPPSSIAFIRPGQRVRVALDSYPFQRFGTITGTLANVSMSVTDNRLAGQPARFGYLATVRLDTEAINTYGYRSPLLAGMTASVSIVIRRMTLTDIFLDPFYARVHR